MLNFLDSLSIRKKILFGFGVVTTILAISVIVTVIEVRITSNEVTKIVTQAVPTTEASSELVNKINASQSALRGWILTGEDKYKKERTADWFDIEIQKENLDRLSQNWENQENINSWTKVKTILERYKVAQQKG